MNARAGKVEHPAPRPTCEVATLLNGLHPVARPKRQRGNLGRPLLPRAVLGVEELHEAMKLLVRELLRHLRDLAQQLVVGHYADSLPGSTGPMLDGGSRRHSTEARERPDEANVSAARRFCFSSAPGLW